MKTTTHFRQVLTLLLTLAAMAVGQNEAKASNWTVTENTTTSTSVIFTVSRDQKASYAETFYYRTVSLSAIDGKHFLSLSSSKTIPAGDDRTSFEVPFRTPSGAYMYQDGTKRRFRVEILDRAGFVLATYDYDRTVGTDVNTFTNLYSKTSVTVNAGEITVKDENYVQAYHAVPLANYFTTTRPQAYLLCIGAQLRMTLGFQAKEKDDGYQHVQILVNQTSNHDEGAGDNNPGTMNYSSYMACFCHKPGSTNTTYANYLFPVTSKGDHCGTVATPWSDLGNTVGELRQQYFNTDCRADDGRLIIPTNLETLGIRFDASGDNEDTWYAYNTIAFIEALDVTSPDQQGDIVLSPGRHAKGNVAYISVPFSEAVNVVGGSNLKLSTTWGDFKYEAGSGSNVLTFKGTITANAGTELSITRMNDQSGSGASIYIADLSGRRTYFASTMTKTFTGVTVDADLTYTLDDFIQDSEGNYLISTVADLKGLASYVNAGNDATGLTFRQTNNITGIGTLTPIGVSDDKAFNGTYDGGGYSLSDITINGNSANNKNDIVGLFGVAGTNAVVKNVRLKSSTFKGNKHIGGIVGDNYGVIRNCLVESSVTVAYYSASQTPHEHGGIAGFSDEHSSIEGCRSAAKLTVPSLGGQWYGGIVGLVHGTVKDCLYTGGTFGTNYTSYSYGTITGRATVPSSQILFNNYYTTDDYKAVGWTTTDVDGARKARTLTLGEGLSIVADVTTYDVSGITAYGDVAIGYNNKIYSGATQTLTLNYSGEVPEGSTLVLSATDAGNNDITSTAISGNVLTMPDADVTVTVHLYGSPVWTWAADYSSAMATFTCSLCQATLTVNADVTQEGNTYTATVTLNGTTYTDTQNVLYVGRNIVHLPGHNEYAYYTFTAPADGWYYIWSEGCLEYLNAAMPIGNGWWGNQGIYYMGNDFTTLREITAGTTNTFQFYTWNAADVPVFVKKAETHTVTLVQPADGSIEVYDRNRQAYISDTGTVLEGAMVRLYNDFGAEPWQSVTWTVTDADGQPVKVYTYFINYDTYTYFFMPDKDVTVTATLHDYLFLDDASTDNSRTLEYLDNNGYWEANVCIGRTLYKDGSWNTLCLPFDVNLESEGCPLAGATVKTLDTENTTMDGTHVHLAFIDAGTTLYTGEPYIIKWDSGDDIVNPVFNNVYISLWTNPQWAADGFTRFIGYYDAFGIDATNSDIYYMTADNTLKHTAKPRTLKGFRAYFQFTANENGVKPLTFDIDFGDDEATSIHDMDEVLSTRYNEVYDLSGRRVSTPTKGLYIVNGKKVFVK